MATNNPTWGQERVADELSLKLGILVSPRTVKEYWPGLIAQMSALAKYGTIVAVEPGDDLGRYQHKSRHSQAGTAILRFGRSPRQHRRQPYPPPRDLRTNLRTSGDGSNLSTPPSNVIALVAPILPGKAESILLRLTAPSLSCPL
jgi:hypothetical protein